MSSTPLTFRYPSYSEHYFEKKNQLEKHLREELKTLSEMQPFYESCMTVFRKHPFTNEIKIEQFGTTIFWTLTFNPSDCLRLIKPLIEDFEVHFQKNQTPHFSTWENYVSWTFSLPDCKTLILRGRIPGDGLLDVSVKKIPRITTTTQTEYIPTNPWWKEE